MSAVKRITGLFDRVKAPLSRISGDSSPKDIDLILAVIQRIEVEGEDHAAPDFVEGEQGYRRLMRRLDWQLKSSGITVEELIRTYPREVKALLVFKSYEKSKRKKESTTFREVFIGLGFKPIQPGVWILPPTKTPAGLDSQEALKVWFRQQMTRRVNRAVDYVFPFIALVDLKNVVSERRGIRKMPTARTLFGVLSAEEVVPHSHLYGTMKSRGMSVKEIILSGNLPLLSSAFAEKEDQDNVQEKELEIGRRLRYATGAAKINLEDIANLGTETVSKALDGVVAHPKDFAQRLIVEAQYWMRLLGGTVPDQNL